MALPSGLAATWLCLLWPGSFVHTCLFCRDVTFYNLRYCGIYGITVFAVRYLHAVYEIILLDSFIVLCCGMLFNVL